MSYKNIPRLFINKVLKENIEIYLNVKDRHYLKNVLRLSEMKKIQVFNGKDGEWEALISSKDCNKVTCFKKIKKQVFEEGANLYFSIIKSQSLRWLLEKSTELGVKNLYPMLTDRVNVRNLNYKKANLYLKEASEVSERLELPKLHNIINFKEFIVNFKNKSENIIFCNEERTDIHLSTYLKQNFSKNISFIIGPEGGFSDDEIKIVYKNPFIKRVKIHDRILKAETAAVLVLSIYKNYLQLARL
jgi:16S rRNA (uracil1498-N3)-methyltransferase